MFTGLSEFVFSSMGNLRLVRRNAYLSHLRTGIKPDTLTALRSAPLHIPALFPDSAIKRAEEDIAQFESKSHSGSTHSKGRYHPYERQDKRWVNRDSRSDKSAWKTIGRRPSKGSTSCYSSWPAKGQQSYKWQLLCSQVTNTTAGRELNTNKTDNENSSICKCKLSCCHTCLYCPRAFAKERCKSWGSRLSLKKMQIKICEKCFLCHSIVLCKTCHKCQKCCLKSACRGETSKLLANLAGPGVVQIRKEGYPLSFRIWPKLTRYPTVISCYVNPHRNSYLLEALHQLIDKNAVELVQNQTSLGFFNRLFLVLKPNSGGLY